MVCTAVHMLGEVMFSLYVSVESWYLQKCRINVCNLGCVGRRLSEVHCVWGIVCSSEILILGYGLFVQCMSYGKCCLQVLCRVLLFDIVFRIW
jgi:hypothetical protein